MEVLGQGWLRTWLLLFQKGCSHQGQMWMFLDCILGCCGSDVQVPGARGEAQHSAVPALPALTSPFALVAGTKEQKGHARTAAAGGCHS